LSVHNRQGAQRAGEEAEDSANQAQWTFAVLLLVGLILTLLTAWLLSQSVTAPLNQLKAVAARIAGGDLSQDVRVHGADEITEVQPSLQQMQVALRDTLRGIPGSATQPAAAADATHAAPGPTSRASP